MLEGIQMNHFGCDQLQQSLLLWDLQQSPHILSKLHFTKWSFCQHLPLSFCNNLSSYSVHSSFEKSALHLTLICSSYFSSHPAHNLHFLNQSLFSHPVPRLLFLWSIFVFKNKSLKVNTWPNIKNKNSVIMELIQTPYDTPWKRMTPKAVCENWYPGTLEYIPRVLTCIFVWSDHKLYFEEEAKRQNSQDARREKMISEWLYKKVVVNLV